TLGLCFANEAGYSQMLVDKFLYMMPEDQLILRECMRRPNLMDDFIQSLAHRHEDWYQQNLKLFIEVCELHGQTAIQHHNELVTKYITEPSVSLEQQHLAKVTASGPPLHVLLGSLEKLRDRRAAANRSDIRTRYQELQTLKDSIR
ncbi:MAG: monodechloroaminopyrrolnitrin synthase PrnB family protein, partial [Shewanella sp.]